MRQALVIAAILATCVPAAAQQAQSELDAVLRDTTAERIARMRSICALGQASAATEAVRSVGRDTPSAAPWCVTVLTRAGRDGTLGYVREPNSNELKPALAFDNGFVGGFLKREAVPVGAPVVAALLPVAERCLNQAEPNTRLCTSVGYMLGLRAAKGEVVTLR